MNQEYIGPINGRPEFNFLASLEVSTRRPIVVNDIMKCQLKPGVTPWDIDRAAEVFFASSFEVQPIYCSAEQLFEPTTRLLKTMIHSLDERTTAIIFPGNGAKPLYEDLWKPNFSSGFKNGNVFTDTDIWVKRVFENGKPKNVTVELGKNIRDAFDRPTYKTVIVVDDVISSGMTLNSIRKQLEYAPFRKYNFIGVSWFCRSPNDVEDYKTIYSAINYKSSEGYPALNSISTFLRTDAKGLVVREAYKQKSWIKYGYGFDKEIRRIRSLTTI